MQTHLFTSLDKCLVHSGFYFILLHSFKWCWFFLNDLANGRIKYPMKGNQGDFVMAPLLQLTLLSLVLVLISFFYIVDALYTYIYCFLIKGWTLPRVTIMWDGQPHKFDKQIHEINRAIASKQLKMPEIHHIYMLMHANMWTCQFW